MHDFKASEDSYCIVLSSNFEAFAITAALLISLVGLIHAGSIGLCSRAQGDDDLYSLADLVDCGSNCNWSIFPFTTPLTTFCQSSLRQLASKDDAHELATCALRRLRPKLQ